MINRKKTLIVLQARKNQVFESTRLFDSDGDIADEGAIDHLGEIEELMATVSNPKKTDEDIRAIAICVGLQSDIKEQ